MNCFQGTSLRLALISTVLLGTFTSINVYAQTTDNTPKVKVFLLKQLIDQLFPARRLLLHGKMELI